MNYSWLKWASLVLLLFTSNISAKEYIRDIYFKPDLNDPDSPKILAKVAIKKKLALEFWSQLERKEQLTDNNAHSIFSITTKEISDHISFLEIIEWKSYGGRFYLKALLSANASALTKRISANRSKVNTKVMAISYTGKNTDSRAKILKNAIDQIKADVLFDSYGFVEADKLILQKRNETFFDSRISRTTASNISVREKNVTWSNSTVYLTAEVAVYDDGLLENFEKDITQFQVKTETYKYFDRPSEEYVHKPASKHYNRAVAFLEKYEKERYNLRRSMGMRASHDSLNISSDNKPPPKPDTKKAKYYIDEAVRYFTQDAESGDADSMSILCHLHSIDLQEIVTHLKRDLHWCQEAAFNGNAISQVLLGFYLSVGDGIELDGEAAVLWLERGLQNVIKQHEYDTLTNDQIFGIDKSHPIKMIPHNIKMHSTKILHLAMSSIGRAYKYGIGTKVDFEKAKNYFTKCSEEIANVYSGGDCYYELGRMFEDEANLYDIDSDKYRNKMLKALKYYSFGARRANFDSKFKVCEIMSSGFVSPQVIFKTVFGYVWEPDKSSNYTEGEQGARFYSQLTYKEYSKSWTVAELYAKHWFPNDLASGIEVPKSMLAIITEIVDNAKKNREVQLYVEHRKNGLRGYSTNWLGNYYLNNKQPGKAIPLLEEAVFYQRKGAEENLLRAYALHWLKFKPIPYQWHIGEEHEDHAYFKNMMLLSKKLVEEGNSVAMKIRSDIISFLEDQEFYKKIRKKKGIDTST